MEMVDWSRKACIVLTTEDLREECLEQVTSYMLNNQEKYYLMETDVPADVIPQLYGELSSKAQEEEVGVNVRIADNFIFSLPAILHIDNSSIEVDDLAVLLEHLLSHEKKETSIWLELCDYVEKKQVINRLSLLHEYVSIKTGAEHNAQVIKNTLMRQKEEWQEKISEAKKTLEKYTDNSICGEQGQRWQQIIGNGIKAFDVYWQDSNEEKKVYLYDCSQEQYIEKYLGQNRIKVIKDDLEDIRHDEDTVCFLHIPIDELQHDSFHELLANLPSSFPRDRLVFVLSRKLLRDDTSIVVLDKALLDLRSYLRQMGIDDCLVISLDGLELSLLLSEYESTQNITCEMLQRKFNRFGREDFLIGNSLRKLYGDKEAMTKENLLQKSGWINLLSVHSWLGKSNDFDILREKIKTMMDLLDADNWKGIKQDLVTKQLLESQKISSMRMELALAVEQQTHVASGVLYKAVMYDIAEMVHTSFEELKAVQKRWIEENGVELNFQNEEMEALYADNPSYAGVIDDINILQEKVSRSLQKMVEEIPDKVQEVVGNFKIKLELPDLPAVSNNLEYKLITVDDIIRIVKENTVIVCDGTEAESLAEAKEYLRRYFLHEVIICKIIEHIKKEIDNLSDFVERDIVQKYKGAMKEIFAAWVCELNNDIKDRKCDFRKTVALYLRAVEMQKVDIENMESLQKDFSPLGNMWRKLLSGRGDEQI